MKTMKCPNDDQEMQLTELQKKVQFRGIEINYPAEAYVCSRCGLEAGTITQTAHIQSRISNAYRKKSGLLTGEEIARKRKAARLTQEDLAHRMEVGIASIKRWEGTQIQSKSMDKALRQALENCSCGDKYTGNKDFSISKVKLVLRTFERFLDRQILRVNDKLLYAAKYLWYADMIHFRETGESITGATYAALPLGPLLNNYTDLVKPILAADESEAEPLTADEERAIERVALTFPQNRAVFDAAHREQVWSEKAAGRPIPYTDAERMTEI